MKGEKVMNEYINLTIENIEEEHICCAIGDPKHQNGVYKKRKRCGDVVLSRTREIVFFCYIATPFVL